MVFLCPGVNDDIVQVDQGELQIELSKTILHKVLKCSGHVAQALGHSEKLVHTDASHGERRVLAGLF